MIDFDLANLTEREKNILMVLDCAAENEPISAVDIAKKTGLSPATISRAVNTLKKEKIIIENTKENTEMGRPPILISINPGYCCFLHFYISRGALYGYLADFSGNLLCSRKTVIENTIGIDEFVKVLRQCAEDICSQKKVQFSKIAAAGVSVPGLVDEKNRVVKNIPNFVNFNNKDMMGLAEKELGMPVIVNNTARLCAVGEHITNYKFCRNLVYMDFTGSSGIGAGIIINGTLHTGVNGIAGEIGSMLVDAHDYSGRFVEGEGFLESLAGVGVMLDRIDRMMSRGHAGILKSMLKEGEELTLKSIETAVRNQDLDVQDVFEETMKLWGMAALNLALVVDPEVIILGGAVTAENDIVLSRVEHFVSKIYGNDMTIRLGGDHSKAQYIGGVHQLKRYQLNHIMEQVPF